MRAVLALVSLALFSCEPIPLNILHVKNSVKHFSHLAQLHARGTPSSTEMNFRVGQRGTLKGLAKASAFNGKSGTIQRWSDALGKYYVKLDGVEDVFTVKPDNIDVLDPVATPEKNTQMFQAELHQTENRNFVVGDSVAIQGLQSDASFNGKIGKVVQATLVDDHGVERLLVEVNGESFALKSENLVKVSVRLANMVAPTALVRTETPVQSEQVPVTQSVEPVLSSSSTTDTAISEPPAETADKSPAQDPTIAVPEAMPADTVARLFAVGERVKIQDLRDQPNFNGKLATVSGSAEVDEHGIERFLVKVDGKEFAIRATNLVKSEQIEQGAPESVGLYPTEQVATPAVPTTSVSETSELMNEIARIEKENLELEAELAKHLEVQTLVQVGTAVTHEPRKLVVPQDEELPKSDISGNVLRFGTWYHKREENFDITDEEYLALPQNAQTLYFPVATKSDLEDIEKEGWVTSLPAVPLSGFFHVQSHISHVPLTFGNWYHRAGENLDITEQEVNGLSEEERSHYFKIDGEEQVLMIVKESWTRGSQQRQPQQVAVVEAEVSQAAVAPAVPQRDSEMLMTEASPKDPQTETDEQQSIPGAPRRSSILSLIPRAAYRMLPSLKELASISYEQFEKDIKSRQASKSTKMGLLN
eukprot:c45945_g1_i1.p1 GENE.c45945_g1_i1~~c45945_g1_i1.p1  ORF type:complete len:647 (+),score=111.30 c45945_g1_i1:60-2000(+)